MKAVYAGLAFFVAGAIAVLQTAYDGSFAFIWPASPVLFAYLATTEPRDWPKGIAACSIASISVTGFLGLGWSAAPGLLVANLTEAIAAAYLFRKNGLLNGPVESVRWLIGYLMATASLGVIASSVVAAATLVTVAGGDFMTSLVNWYTGHALGLITFAPIFIFIARGELKVRLAEASRGQLLELVLLTLLVSGISALVFMQVAMPLLFLPLLPIILTTFRLGRLGAAISIVALALIASYFTLQGWGPISLMQGAFTSQVRFLQFYLAATILTILPVAAELARRSQLMRDLRHSEARYRILAEHSTDIIINIDLNGNIRFVSPAVRQLLGYEPNDLRGSLALLLVADDHVEAVKQAHMRAARARGESVRLEFLGRARTGDLRWFETQIQAVSDEHGQVDGTVGVIRDIGERKALETSLSDQARRDSLTGLLNRRGFLLELDRLLTDAAPAAPTGCLALFDLDYFKRINDEHGHPVGDAVLRHFAAVAGGMLRDSDRMGRIGGEEFALLLRATTLEDAASVCDRLRAAVAATPYMFEGKAVFLTVSGGVTPLRAAPASELLALADVALYRAKAAGRDRMKIAA